MCDAHQFSTHGFPTPTMTISRRYSLPALLCVALLAGAVLTGCSVGDPNLNEAESALEDGNYEAALESVERALDENPENPDAYLTRAQIFEQQATEVDDPDERVRLYEQVAEARNQALEIDPSLEEDVQGTRQFSYIDLMQRGADSFNEAQQEQETALFRETASYFASAGLIFPDSSAAHTNEAFALLNAGDREEVIPVLEEAIATVPEADTADVDLYSILGSLYLQFDRADDALPLLDEAVEYYSDNQEIQELRLNAFTATGETERALEAYREQVEQNPDEPVFRYNYGSLLLNDEQYEEAAEQLKRASELDPDNGDIFFNLGAAYVNQAAEFDEQMSEVEEQLREEEREATDEEQEQFDEWSSERQSLIEQSIPPFERAYELLDEGSDNYAVVCRELYRSYVLVERTDEAEELESCFDNIDEERPEMNQPQQEEEPEGQ